MQIKSEIRKSMSVSQRIRDAGATQKAILDSAEREFASYGLSGARTEVIAADTGVTKAMIHHYFQTKEKLYEATIERIINNLVESINQMKLESMSADQAIRALMAKLLDTSIYPHYPGIMVNESLQNKGRFFREKGGLRIEWEIIALLKRGISDGIFRPIAPETAALTILGAANYIFAARYNTTQLFPNQSPDSHEQNLNYVEQALDIVLQGIKV